MKKAILALSLCILLLLPGKAFLMGQDAPKPKKDTVNMDTYAKPQTFYDIEDDKASSKKGSGTTIAIICGVVVIAAGVGFFLLRKRKK